MSEARHPSLDQSRESCQCEKCQSWCRHVPGWFLPGEAEQAAALKALTLDDFFRRYLTVDYWLGAEDRFVLRPATTREDAGNVASYDPRGQCVFYRDGKCEIHDAKPHECAITLHNREVLDGTHQATGKAWEGHQAQIEALLGEKPEEPYSDVSDMWSLLFR